MTLPIRSCRDPAIQTPLAPTRRILTECPRALGNLYCRELLIPRLRFGWTSGAAGAFSGPIKHHNSIQKSLAAGVDKTSASFPRVGTARGNPPRLSTPRLWPGPGSGPWFDADLVKGDHGPAAPRQAVPQVKAHQGEEVPPTPAGVLPEKTEISLHVSSGGDQAPGPPDLWGGW
jgi:hypothetical protein